MKTTDKIMVYVTVAWVKTRVPQKFLSKHEKLGG